MGHESQRGRLQRKISCGLADIVQGVPVGFSGGGKVQPGYGEDENRGVLCPFDIEFDEAAEQAVVSGLPFFSDDETPGLFVGAGSSPASGLEEAFQRRYIYGPGAEGASAIPFRDQLVN